MKPSTLEERDRLADIRHVDERRDADEIVRHVSAPERIVRRLAGDRYVVDVAFAQARAGDPHEARLGAEALPCWPAPT